LLIGTDSMMKCCNATSGSNRIILRQVLGYRKILAKQKVKARFQRIGSGACLIGTKAPAAFTR
jgi:hypothetical protein